MWLRLKRAGGTFTGYASVRERTGRSWGTHSSLSAPLPTLYVGLVTSSRRTNQLATAHFRELKQRGGQPSGGRVGGLESRAAGPSTRRTGFAVSEIMFSSAGGGA